MKLRTSIQTLLLLLGITGLQAQQASLINMQTGDAPALMGALKSQGISVVTSDSRSSTFPGSLVILQAHGNLSVETVEALRIFVQHGGSLLMGFDQHPGVTPSQLAFMSPTTSWISQSEAGSRPLVFTPIDIGSSDESFFPSNPQITVPWFFPIRPVSGVERGSARYDRYEIKAAANAFSHDAGSFYWTRPLLNRDWKVRLFASDRAKSPLLITGRYGAGRVAVFASSLEGEGEGLESLWRPVVEWLSQPVPAGPEPAAKSVEISSTEGQTVVLKNITAQPLTVQVLARILTWERAFLRDALQTVTVPANGVASVVIPLPEAEYQALEFRRAYFVRTGVLSASGATLLAEQNLSIDLSPAATVALTTDNLYRIQYPFPDAPGIDTLPGMRNRMGMPVAQYAYPPLGTLHATAVFTNGVRNIASLASVTDETTPENASTMALTDGGALANKIPRSPVSAYGIWIGKAGKENVLRFHFSTPVTVTAVTLLGSSTKDLNHNPGAIAIEAGSRSLVKNLPLDERFTAENGLVRIPLPATQTTDLTIRLPWIATANRAAPWLGEVEIDGSTGPLPAGRKGTATLVLFDAMSAKGTLVAKREIVVPPGGRTVWVQTIRLPETDRGFYQLQARFLGQIQTTPVLVIRPGKTLTSIQIDHPPGAPVESFVTTKGFRQGSTLDTGTLDLNSTWNTPDDEIYAYSHQLKQVPANPGSWSQWLFVTETDMNHYSTPWGLFPNGQNYFEQSAPKMIERMKHMPGYTANTHVAFGFGDRWDSGPSLTSLYGWQELVAFDEFLRAEGRPALTGRTHSELSQEVNEHYASEWALWHEHRYVTTVEGLRTAFAALGKDLTISGQGIPMTTNTDAAILSKTVRGMASDSTWGMESESIPLTTGRQLAGQAFNPEWRLNFNFVWGYDSSTLNNYYWYGPVGTTESSRRHYYDSAWRAILNQNGDYISSYAYGFGNNGGEAWTMGLNDYQQSWNAQERFSLIYPEQPLGAGLIVSSSPVDAPTAALFSGGGMGPDGSSEALVHQVAVTFERLHDAGLSIPYMGNISAVAKSGSTNPIILEDLATATPEEVQILKGMAARGTHIAIFAGPGDAISAARELLGDHPVAQELPDGPTLLTNGNILLIPVQGYKLTPKLSMELAPMLQHFLDLPITLPKGTMGYGFLSGGRTMVVLEDWQEEGREVAVRIRASGSAAHAVSLNDHAPLPVSRDGGDWVVRVPLRPGDGEVVVLDQTGAAQ